MRHPLFGASPIDDFILYNVKPEIPTVVSKCHLYSTPMLILERLKGKSGLGQLKAEPGGIWY